MDKVDVKGLRFKGFHGCHAEERLTGGVFETDVTLSLDNSKAANSDQIGDAVDYVAVMDVVEHVMNVPKNLIETVANEIAKALLNRFPQCEDVVVTVKKLSPPVHHEVEYVSVTHALKRGEINS